MYQSVDVSLVTAQAKAKAVTVGQDGSGKYALSQKVQLEMRMKKSLENEEKELQKKRKEAQRQLGIKKIDASIMAKQCKDHPKDKALAARFVMLHQNIKSLECSILKYDEHLNHIGTRRTQIENIKTAMIQKSSLEAQRMYTNAVKNDIDPTSVSTDIAPLMFDTHVVNEGIDALNSASSELHGTIIGAEKSQMDRLNYGNTEDIGSLLEMYGAGGVAVENNNSSSRGNSRHNEDDYEDYEDDEDEDAVEVRKKLETLMNLNT